MHRENAAAADLAVDLQPAAMPADDVLDDGEAEAGAADGAAARRVDPVESLGQARQVLLGDALALVADGHDQAGAPSFRDGAGGNADDAVLSPVIDRVRH